MPADFENADHGLETLQVTMPTAWCSRVALRRRRTVRGYLGDAMLEYFDCVFDGRELHVLGYLRQGLPCNWKLMFEKTLPEHRHDVQVGHLLVGRTGGYDAWRYRCSHSSGATSLRVL